MATHITLVYLARWIVVLLLVHAGTSRGQVSNVARDQEIVLFPTVGYRAAIGKGWDLEIHGCVYEEDKHRIAIGLLREGLLFDHVNLTPSENALFVKRTRLFMVDHERGKRIVISAGGKVIKLNKSRPDGQFSGTMHLPPSELPSADDGTLTIHALLSAKDTRVFTGEVSLLGETGLTVISDIDDTIKITQVRDRRAALRNTFLEPFRAVPGMADVYQRWRREAHAQFCYVSASPWQLFLPLEEFIRSAGFPEGPFYLKDFRWKDESFFNLFESPEKYKPKMIEPLLKRFPNRHFVLVGDSGESDPEIYGALARRFPVQVTRILIREVTNAPKAGRYDAAFFGVPPTVWKVFRKPSEIEDEVR